MASRTTFTETSAGGVYTPLDAASKQIRVLYILPSQEFDADIHATLHIVSLGSDGKEDTPPFYKALSYCWGNPGITRSIVLDGQEWQVTVSLETALRNLRKTDEEFIIWADAVCINQQDAAERGSQVQMMADIYRSASSVVVWLGEEGDDSSVAMDTCVKWGGDGSSSRESSCRILGDVVEPVDLRTWRSVRSFFQRPYWSRLWIYQEVKLARAIVVKCGAKEISWDSFAGLIEADYEIHRKGVILEQSLKRETWDLVRSRGLNVLSLFFSRKMEIKQDRDFFVLLRDTASQDCSEPKDRMYALLSLAEDADRYPAPDYRASVSFAEVYTEYARIHIRSTGCLDMLNEAASRLYDVDLNDQRMPSWVPDWRVKRRHEMLRRNTKGVVDFYHASRLYRIGLGNEAIPGTDGDDRIPPEIAVPQHMPIIRPLGVKCDQITKVAQLPLLDMSYASIVEFMGRGVGDGAHHPTGLPIFNVLFRTSLLGLSPTTHKQLTTTEFVNTFGEGFLLQVALDFGFLRKIAFQDIQPGGAADSGFGLMKFEEYRLSHPGLGMLGLDFDFLPDPQDKGEAREKYIEEKDYKKFASFRAFMKATVESIRSNQMGAWGCGFQMDQWRKLVRDSVEGRTLFVTRFGYIGLATNASIKPGDSVAVLYGGKTPFILRSAGSTTPSDETDAKERHRLVSDAYIEGLMQGEAIEREDCWMRDHPDEPALREFCII
ncbi:heterokaryon incompatibility protein-domain-containing protein [Podospora didyma]|uniref:Heterokaryon incompatibility protein-domain-containing protein n=1 Tax=Podospora didyma TaxID=330526 RepID=A0AAE0P8K8_9PEZI|nr:heterokaryon incompatibility protein-domain-containing protein [Podospora didyma]